ncbi:24078_t:CDS:1, partial [Gigaspora margarita]
NVIAIQKINVTKTKVYEDNRYENEHLMNIVKKASNFDNLMIKKIESIDSHNLEKKGHYGKIICWSRENEQNDGTIKGLESGVNKRKL